LCAQKNDRFTVNDVSVGNAALEKPVVLITMDEASLAEQALITANTTNYLYTNQSFWSPSPFASAVYATVLYMESTGYCLNNRVHIASGLRPVINLNSNTQVTGDGSAASPFKVI